MSSKKIALERIAALHQSNGGHNPLCHCGIKAGSGASCTECRVPYPCPTVQLIEVDA